MQGLSYSYSTSTNLLYVTITEINTNMHMYEYAINKHAYPPDVTLQSIYYEIQSNNLFAITIS